MTLAYDENHYLIAIKAYLCRPNIAKGIKSNQIHITYEEFFLVALLFS
jgi:hypothetical protein